MYGADVTQLRELAGALSRGASSLQDVATSLTSSVGTLRWPGPDGAQFSGEWNNAHRAVLVRAGAALDAASATLLRNAAAQEATSAADGGSRPSWLESSDRPGDPNLQDDLGDYVDITDPIDMSDDAFDVGEINQGQVGDCWLVASLGSVGAFDPDFIRDHMWQNPDGTWTVKMFDNGTPVYIQVEPTIPENGVRDADGDPSWASIYEKAAAEYFGGSYDSIDGDFPDRALEAITGQPAQNLGEASFDEIKAALENGPVVASSELDFPILWWGGVDDKDLVVPQHVYMVTGIVDVTDADGVVVDRYIEMSNPWGPNGSDNRYGTFLFTEEQYRDNFREITVGSMGD